ncbi:unnamed protein product [Calicophoron daubneyi]|uniref:FHA domain-containing protein n=1 Tax=Calicophoron daubneyi TaxID=300641 RepID=A0AAV2SZ85_CALDB
MDKYPSSTVSATVRSLHLSLAEDPLMSAFLRAVGWAFLISPKVTIIGRSGCDITIKDPSVDEQHALIERNIKENRFTLRDLCSNAGTYVNDVPIGEDPVVLNDGDKLRFGCAAATYEVKIGMKDEAPRLQDEEENSSVVDRTFDSCGGRTTHSLDDLSTLTEKDKQINILRGKVRGVPSTEAVSVQKDVMIRSQDQLGNLSNTQAHHNISSSSQLELSLANLEARKTGVSQSHTTLQNTRPNSSSNQVEPVNQNSNKNDADLLRRLQREHQILSGLVTQLQRDLSNKDANVGRLMQEMGELKNQLKEKDCCITELHHKRTQSPEMMKLVEENEARGEEVVALRQKFRAAEIRCRTLTEEADKNKLRMETMRKEAERYQAIETELRNELNELKVKMDEAEHLKRVALLDKQETASLYERLRNRMIKLICAVIPKPVHLGLTQDPISSNSGDVVEAIENKKHDYEMNPEFSGEVVTDAPEIDDCCILDRLKIMVENYLNLQRQIDKAGEEKKQKESGSIGVEQEIEKFTSEFSEAQGVFFETSNSRSSARLRGLMDWVSTLTCSNKSLKRLQWLLVKDLQNQVDTHQRIEDCIQEAAAALSSTSNDSLTFVTGHSDDIIGNIRRFAEFGVSARLRYEEASEKLRKLQDLQHKEIMQVKENQANELRRQVEDAVSKNNQEHADELRRNVLEVVRVEGERCEQIINVKQAIIDELEDKLRETRKMLADRQIDYEASNKETQEAGQRIAVLERTLQEKQEELLRTSTDLEQTKSTLERNKTNTEKASEDRWRNEIETHREQIRQHARTICVLEERLVKLSKQLKESKAEVSRLRRQLSVITAVYDLHTEHQSLQARLNAAKQKLSSGKRAIAHGLEEKQPEPESLGSQSPTARPSDSLKYDVTNMTLLLSERDRTIEVLQRDLEGARAQLSDLRSELSEAQKEEMETALEHGRKSNSQLLITEARASQLTTLVSALRKQISENEETIKRQTFLLEELRTKLNQRECEAAQMNSLLAREREVHMRDLSRAKSTDKLADELAAVGGECRGERHHEIIEKQCQALSELRQRLRDQPSSGNNVDATEYANQLSRLRREIAELRSQKALRTTFLGVENVSSRNSHIPEKHSSKPVLNDDTADFGIEELKSVVNALNVSEEGYLDLVRGLSQELGVGCLPGQLPLTHLQNLEHSAIQRERQQAAELVLKRVAILQDQIQRKEEMLTNYERDVARMKEAEALSETRGKQIEKLISQLQTKDTEILLLRDSLTRTREALSGERRLAPTIRQNKTTSTVSGNNFQRLSGQRKECLNRTGNMSTKEAEVKNEHKESLRRKDFEIKALKNQLDDREQQLKALENELTHLKITLVC